MPNDCWNHLTIACQSNPAQLSNLINTEFTTKDDDNKVIYKESVKVIQKGIFGIKINVWSAWKPDYEWLEKLLVKYPECWVKNEWSEEGGNAGVWVGAMKPTGPEIKRLEWDDLTLEGNHFLFL